MFQVQQHLSGCTDLCKPVNLVNPLFRAILGQTNLISSGFDRASWIPRADQELIRMIIALLLVVDPSP